VINLIFAFFLLFLLGWAAKKFYFPTDMAQRPGLYPARKSPAKISRKELGTVLAHLQRWKQEGKISREEYDHLTDLCLSELEEGRGAGAS